LQPIDEADRAHTFKRTTGKTASPCIQLRYRWVNSQARESVSRAKTKMQAGRIPMNFGATLKDEFTDTMLKGIIRIE
jgi:hypothetical protein